MAAKHVQPTQNTAQVEALKSFGCSQEDAESAVAEAQKLGINVGSLISLLIKALPYIKGILDLLSGMGGTEVPSETTKK